MMAGGTIENSRAVLNHSHDKKRFEALGFGNVTLTALDRDALYSLVRELRPGLLIMGARFYQCCTPFLMGDLKRKFPKIKMAAVCIGDYPADFGMYFNLNGGNSFVTSFDGVDQFYQGLEEIRKGREYLSPAARESINMRRDYPLAAKAIPDRQREVMRLMCCGFKDLEIAKTLHISRRTVDYQKTELFTSLNVRNAVELIRAALTLGVVRLEEIYFYPEGFTVNPVPEQKIKNRAVKEK
jgi:DNA-binding NarL/FixJ family response regulator